MKYVDRTYRIAWSAGILAALFLLVGCSDDLSSAPPVEVPFTMFGVVNPTADTQAVIVYPVESGALQPIGPEPLDAVVRSTESESGEVRVWRDSVISDGGSGHSHIFWSEFRAGFGHTYRIEAVRSDGAASSVAVDVPRMVGVEETDEGSSRLQVTFRGGRFRLVKLDLTYDFGLASGPASGCPERYFSYTFSYAGEETKTGDGWDLIIDLNQYLRFMELLAIEDTGNDLLFADPLTRLALTGLTLRFTVGDDTWVLPRGFLDRRVLSHPRTLTNVENGLGFVGGGYRDKKRLFPSTDAIEDGGYYDYLEGRAGC